MSGSSFNWSQYMHFFSMKNAYFTFKIRYNHILKDKGVNGLKFKIFGIVFLAAGLLTACNGHSGEESAEPEQQQQQNIKELVNDYSTGKIKGHNASITSHELTIADSEGDKQVYDISKEDFFVSIAPYENQTHP